MPSIAYDVSDLQQCYEFLHPENLVPSGRSATDKHWLRTQVWYMREHQGQPLTQRAERALWTKHQKAGYKLYPGYVCESE